MIILLVLLPLKTGAQEEKSLEEKYIEEDVTGSEEYTGMRETVLGGEFPLPNPLSEEAQAELFSFDLGHSDISLMMSGFWKGTLTGSLGVARSPIGFEMASIESPLLFTQEADLTLSLWLFRRWFVEGFFLDDSKLNTYRAGYQGLPGETVQYLGVGNAGLDFPVFPYLDLGGDSPGSFGFYGKFGSGALSVHSLVRYDAAERAERVFVGTRERTFTDIAAEHPLRGRFFVLPDENLDSPPDVYVEDKDGTVLGGDGRRWRKLGASEYAASARFGIVELREEPLGEAAVSYKKNGNSRPWDASLGSYGSSGFLKSVEDFFAQKGSPVFSSLTHYPQSGQEDPSLLGTAGNKPGTVFISGIPALVVYEKGTFSPFEGQSRYNAPSSATAEADLIHPSTGERVAGFSLVSVSEITRSPELDLLGYYTQDRLIYDLARDNGGTDRRSAGKRWPLAAEYPEIYLPGNNNYSEDITVRFTNYGASGAYNLGSDVVPGSVQVYREGLEDPRFKFSEESGVVTLENPAGFNEIIRITYLKRSDERRDGSLAAGLGLIYQGENNVNAGLALGLRWNLSQEALSEEGIKSPGTVGLSSYAGYNGENLDAKVSLGLGLEQPDTTSLYRINGMEGSELVWEYDSLNSILSLPPALSSSLPALYTGLDERSRANLVYRNYRQSSPGSASLEAINDSPDAAVVTGKYDPYPSRYRYRANGRDVEENVLVAEFSFTRDQYWTGFQTPLENIGSALETAGEIGLVYKLYDFSAAPPGDFRLIVQFGPLRDNDRYYGENPSLIVEKELKFTPGNQEEWEYTPINLTQDDKRKLREATYMRLLVVGGGSGNLSGRVLVASLRIHGSSSRGIIASNGEITQAPKTADREVKVLETLDRSLDTKYGAELERLHRDEEILPGGEIPKQRVLEISWTGLESGEGPGIDARTGVIPFSDYETLSFFVKAPRDDSAALRNSSLRLAVGNGPGSVKYPDDLYLDARIPLAALPAGSWSKVSINYAGGKGVIKVDGNEQSGDVRFHPPDPWLIETDGQGNKTMYTAVFIEPETGSRLPPSSLSLDEIILEDSRLSYRGNLGFSASWAKPDFVVNLGGVPVVSGMEINSVTESGARGNPAAIDTEVFAAVQNRSMLKTNVLGIETEVDFRANANQSNQAWSLGHDLKRAFGPLNLREAFHLGPYDETFRHELSLGLEAGSGYSAFLGADIDYENEELDRTWAAKGDFRFFESELLGLAFTMDARWLEFTERPKDWMGNYGQGWFKTLESMKPDTGKESRERDIAASFSTSVNTLPIGAALTLEATSAYRKPQSSTLQNSLGRLDFPFQFGNFQGNFYIERGFEQDLAHDGEDITDDLGRFGDSLSLSSPLWFRVPFHSIFENRARGRMDEIKSHYPEDTFNSARFTDSVSLSLKMPEQKGALALFIPNSLSSGIERTLHQKLDTLSDVNMISANLGFSAINLFGAFGQRPLFSFYESDEITHSLEGAVSFPRGEEALWRFQAVERLGFYGFEGAELNLFNTFNTYSEGWSETLSLEWLVPTRRSLLSILYNFFLSRMRGKENWPYFADLAEQNYEQLRKEILELVFESGEDDARFSLVMGHESIIRIMGSLNLSVLGKLTSSYETYTETISFIATLGTSLYISF